ncbi:MAG: hypothetical protein AAF497_19685, partial [Planctomycetota bacterium]
MTKSAGLVVCLMGIALIVFAFFARGELQSVASATTAPKPGENRFLKFVGPELFDKTPAESLPVKPAELASRIANRIYVVGGFGGLMAL